MSVQGSITTKFIIVVCVTAAAGAAAFYYYYYGKKWRMGRTGEKIESEKGAMPTEGAASVQKPAAKEPEPSRKSADLTTALSTSAETTNTHDSSSSSASFSSSSRSLPSSSKSLSTTTRTEKSSESAKIKEQLPTPQVAPPSSLTSSISGKTVSSSDSSSIVPTARLMTTSQVESASISPSLKSAESLSIVSKSSEEISSPTGAIPIDSYCYCGQEIASKLNSLGDLNETWRVELLPTYVKPVSFDPYSPEDLTQVEGSSEELSRKSLTIDPPLKNHYIIIPFLPILHAITYASKHAQLLQELMQNYEYYESQALESS